MIFHAVSQLCDVLLNSLVGKVEVNTLFSIPIAFQNQFTIPILNSSEGIDILETVIVVIVPLLSFEANLIYVMVTSI